LVVEAMYYCSLDDAFQEIGGAPSPGCATDFATKQARKEERRKARRCKGPPAAYLDLDDKDPDRQHLNKLPDVPPMNPATGLRQHSPVTASQGETEPFMSQNEWLHNTDASSINKNNPPSFDKDPMDAYLRSEAREHVMVVPTNGGSSTTKPKKFFGANSPSEEFFADYVPDQEDYKLQPDFLKAFEQAGVARAGTTATLPNPSVNMYWKPLTTSGAQTSFIEQLPPPGGKYHKSSYKRNGEISMEDVMTKMDKLFARLDDMNTSTPEQTTSELLMFISSGIFVIFMMDLLVKKGSTLRF